MNLTTFDSAHWLRELPEDVEAREVPGAASSCDSGFGGEAGHGASALCNILREAGRLSEEDAARIARVQRDKGLSFEEAGLSLGVLCDEDIEFAQARQFDYPYLFEGDWQVSTELVAAYRPASPEVEQLRALRTELRLRWFDAVMGPGGQGVPVGDAPARAGGRLLAVVGTGHGDGRSWLAANLAVAFAQQNEPTLLIDADLRRPRQHQLFNATNEVGLSTVLANHAEPGAVLQRVPALPHLSLITAGAVPPNPQELLGRPAFARLLEEAAREHSVVLIDTPAAAPYADARTIAARAGGAMLVVRRARTRLAEAGQLAAGLARHGVQLVGSVLNHY